MQFRLVSLALIACTRLAFADCGPIPYSVGLKAAGAELTLSSTEVLKTKLSGLSATAGGSFIRNFYATAAQQAMSDVLGYYRCAVLDSPSVKNLKPEDKAALETKITNAVNSLRRKSALYFGAFASNQIESALAIDGQIAETQRKEGDPVIERKILEDAIGETKIPIAATFQEQTLVQGWGTVKLPGITSAACVGYLRAALAANAGDIQHAVATARAILFEYLDGSKPDTMQTALSMLFIEASSAAKTVTPAGKEADNFLKGCSKA